MSSLSTGITLEPGSLLCEPNVSEGRDAERMRGFATAVRDTGGVRLLHASSDPDHHRMVLAYAGPPPRVVEGSRRLAERVFETVDLRLHEGRHPRLGALDVVPFVPLGAVPESAALEACRAFGAWVGARGVPVYYYERAASRPERRALPFVRAGQFEGLADRMERSGWAPDEGPRHPHPSAGAVITGVRAPLVRFNVNLDTPDPALARQIAGAIRESSGGLPAVRALGLELTRRGITQVSMNLVDHARTSIAAVFAEIERGAVARGVSVRGTEVIGLVPRSALDGVPARILADVESEQILEGC